MFEHRKIYKINLYFSNMGLTDLLPYDPFSGEITSGTIVTNEQLGAFGLYNTGKTLRKGTQKVYWGESRGACIVEDSQDGKLTVYLHTKNHSNNSRDN